MKPEPFLKLALAIKINSKKTIVLDSYSNRPNPIAPSVVSRKYLSYNK